MNFKQWLLSEEIEGVRNIYKNLLDLLKQSSEDLYVNFADRPRFEMNPSKAPSHHDPIGIYAFPKNYILKETAGNEGFFSLPYINVFKLKEDAKVLNLSSITEEEAKNLLKKMGIEDYIEKEYFRSRGPTGGHLLWNTMEKYIALNKLSKNITWNKLFEKAGNFDAIKDEGSSVIHSNEPEQIIVLNKNVIDVVDKIENPYKSYVSSFYTNVVNVAKEIGSKYFGDYYIEQFKKGTRKESPTNLYSDTGFYIISKNKKLPYSISFFYGGGTLYVTLRDVQGESNELAKIKYGTTGISIAGYKSKSWNDDPAMLKKDFDKNEVLEEVENNIHKYLKPFDENIGKELTDLLIAINKQLNIPTPQNVKLKDNEAYKEFAYYAGYPIMFKIIVNSNFKDKTNVIFQWQESQSGSYRRKSSYPFAFNTTPQNVNPAEAINQFKTKITTLHADISKSDEWSSSHYYDKTILERLLETLFK
jgi:hypothetical protein